MTKSEVLEILWCEYDHVKELNEREFECTLENETHLVSWESNDLWAESYNTGHKWLLN